ncbi:MAG: hypothetical protein H0Z39_06685 [Peptococcaceae bacterium]|nr:hypothetical protein [Peptococcaceae bacterium]
MHSTEGFEQLIDNSKHLVEALKYDEVKITPLQRAKLFFELRLAYNLTVKRCDDSSLAKELINLLEECEVLLES